MQVTGGHKLNEVLEHTYRQLHSSGAYLGRSAYTDWLPAFEAACGHPGKRRILDFGCGSQGGLASVYADVRSYDPYVAGKDSPPWEETYDIIFSSDVLEHMTRDAISDFLRAAAKRAREYIFLTVSVRAAQNKVLTNGMNVHLTVEPPAWWHGFMQAHLTSYGVVLARHDLINDNAAFCFKRTTPLAT